MTTFRFRSKAAVDRVLWFIVLAAMAESMFQAIDASLQGSWERFVLWVLGSGFIGFLALVVESVKRIDLT